MKSFDRQVLTAIQGFYEKCTQTIENAEFLMLRFLHFFIIITKYNPKKETNYEKNNFRKKK